MTLTTPSPISDQAALLHRLNDATKPVDAADRNLIIRALSTAPTTGSASVAWQVQRIDTEEGPSIWREASISEYLMRLDSPHWNVRELFATPASPAASVLTDDEIDDIGVAQEIVHVGERRKSMYPISMEDLRTFARAVIAASMGGNRS